MGLKFTVFAAITAVLILLFIIHVLRTNLVRGGIITLWVAIAAIMVSIPMAERFYVGLAGLIGLYRAIDMVFLVAISFCLIYIFYLTVRIQKMKDAIQQLMSLVAIMESDMSSSERAVRDGSDARETSPGNSDRE